MTLSVIIPALNEADNIGSAVAEAFRAGPHEVIVVDGGSTDSTADQAARAGARVLTSRPGRGVQQRLGCEHAQGELLVFLHADTRLPRNYPAVVADVLSRPNVSGGAFRFRLDESGASFRWVERLVDWRCKMFALPYGDQAIFVRSATLQRIGGFPDLPIMEDYELVRRLRKLGRIVVADAAATTSARRLRKLGALNAALTNMACLAAYRLGVDAGAIARWRRS